MSDANNEYLPKAGKFDPMARLQHDLRTVAWHEAGHIVVARHFKLDPWGRLRREGEPTIENRAFTGRVFYTPTTKSREAAIGWAGVIAEALQSDGPELGLEVVFENWMDLFLEDLSDTDRAAIFGWPQRWRSCKTAHSILVRKYPCLAREAERLMAEHNVEVVP